MTRPDLAALLRVQERDTGLDRLRYRRSAIPERSGAGRLQWGVKGSRLRVVDASSFQRCLQQ